MNSAFLIFDFVGGTPVLSASAMPDVSSNQNLMTVKKRSDLSAAKGNPDRLFRVLSCTGLSPS
jgi:hypothetical protein